MVTLQGIDTTTPAVTTIGATSLIAPVGSLFSADVGLLPQVSFGSESTVVQLSGLSQFLSAAATYQDQLAALQPGTANSGGGQNFGTDLPSLAAEVQSFVDAFNNVQGNIANISGTTNLLGASVPGTAGLALTLQAQVGETYANGDSKLGQLAQLGIAFQSGGGLSLDLGTLKAAFNADATGAFALLSQAAEAFGNVAGNFVDQVGGLSTLSALSQILVTDQLLAATLPSLSSTTGTIATTSFADLLALGALAPAGTVGASGGSTLLQTIVGLNEFALVLTLLG